MRHVPSGFLHAVPWLMLATALRIIYATDTGLVRHVTFVAANIVIFLAFLLVAHHLIVTSGGRTDIGTLSFGRQIAIGRAVVLRVSLLLTGLSLVLTWAGAPALGAELVYAFDGIAFDQNSRIGMVLSSLLAPLVLMMVLASEAGRRATILAALREFAARRRSLLPAVAAVALFLVILSGMQGVVREIVQGIWQTSWIPYSVRTFTYFVFIFGFASVRLCGSLLILVYALRRSYERGEGSGALATGSPTG